MRLKIISIAAALLSATCVAAAPSTPVGATTPTTFVVGSASTTYTVPTGICGIHVELYGGVGQSNSEHTSGGAAGVVIANLPVGGSSSIQSGDTLTTVIGQSGAHGGIGGAPAGANGDGIGGGGTTLSDGATLLAVAGGGGGAPSVSNGVWDLAAGGGGIIGTSGDTGGAGGSATGPEYLVQGLSEVPATGGTEVGPGQPASYSGADRDQGVGAAGSVTILGGGGDGGYSSDGAGGSGGGGYFGGGGGASGSKYSGGGWVWFRSAGGGGSSWVMQGAETNSLLIAGSYGTNGDGSTSISPLGCESTTFAPMTGQIGQHFSPPTTSDQGHPLIVTVEDSSLGVCRTTGSTVTFIGGGTCKLNAAVSNALSVFPLTMTDSITVAGPGGGQDPQTLNLSSLDLSPLGYGSSRDLTPTTNALDSTVLSASTLTPSTCTIQGLLTVVPAGLGTCTVQITSGGTTYYAPTSAVVALTIVESAPSIWVCKVHDDCAVSISSGSVDLTDLVVFSLSDQTFMSALDTPSQGALSGTSKTPKTCTLAAGKLSTIGFGTCTLKVSQAAASPFLASAQFTMTLRVFGSFTTNAPATFAEHKKYTVTITVWGCPTPSEDPTCQPRPVAISKAVAKVMNVRLVVLPAPVPVTPNKTGRLVASFTIGSGKAGTYDTGIALDFKVSKNVWAGASPARQFTYTVTGD